MTTRVAKFFLNVAVYFGIVFGILFGLPRFLAWYLDTPYPIAAITSGSMWPALKVGDLVFIEGVHKEDLRIGDIVVWRNSQGFTIHRVTKLASDYFVTKGDANFVEDGKIKYEDLVGRTHQVFGRDVRLPYFGMITVYASKK